MAKKGRFQVIGEKTKLSNRSNYTFNTGSKGKFQTGGGVSLPRKATEYEPNRGGHGRFQVSPDAVKLNTSPTPVRDDIDVAELSMSVGGKRKR